MQQLSAALCFLLVHILKRIELHAKQFLTTNAVLFFILFFYTVYRSITFKDLNRFIIYILCYTQISTQIFSHVSVIILFFVFYSNYIFIFSIDWFQFAFLTLFSLRFDFHILFPIMVIQTYAMEVHIILTSETKSYFSFHSYVHYCILHSNCKLSKYCKQ